MKNLLSVSFETNKITFDKEVSADFEDIGEITFDRINNVGIIHVSINGPKEVYEVSLKSAYALMIILGTGYWKDL